MDKLNLQIAQAQLGSLHRLMTIVHELWVDTVARAKPELPDSDVLEDDPTWHATQLLGDIGQLRVAVSEAIKSAENT